MANENLTKVDGEMISLDGGIFNSAQVFNTAQRMASALASSTIVPKEYQGNVGNCLIALEMAARIRTSPMMVMQNLYVVNGRPAWSSLYITAMINNSRKYKTELQFSMSGSGDSLSCYAWAEDYNGHKVIGPTITMQMARDEGWLGRTGSKWKTMPEVMIRYRAASFFGRLNCPEMIMGVYSVEEALEIPSNGVESAMNRAEAEIAQNANATPIDTAPEPVKIEAPEEPIGEPGQPAKRPDSAGQVGMKF
jgi:hypothetical protein